MLLEPNQVQGTVKSVASSRQLLRSAPTPFLDAQVWAAFNVNHSCIEDDDKYDNNDDNDDSNAFFPHVLCHIAIVVAMQCAMLLILKSYRPFVNLIEQKCLIGVKL